MDGEYIWVVESGCGTRFLFKAVESIAIGCKFLAENFDRNLPAEFHVLGQIYLSHAARTELLKNPVMRDVCSFHFPGRQISTGSICLSNYFLSGVSERQQLL